MSRLKGFLDRIPAVSWLMSTKLWLLFCAGGIVWAVRDADSVAELIFECFLVIALSFAVIRMQQLLRAREKDLALLQVSQEKLERSEARFRSFFERAGFGIALLGGGTFVDVNPALAAYLGYRQEELRGRSIIELTHPDDRPEVLKVLSQVKAGLSPMIDADRRYIRKDGEILFAHMTASWIPDDPALGYRCIAVITDITERKLAEEVLDRFESLALHSRDILLFVRIADGAILEANEAASNAYGYTCDELRRMSIFDLRPADQDGIVAAQMRKAAEQGLLFETLHRRRDGSMFPVEVSARGGTIAGQSTLVSVIRDISERKQAEAQQRATAERLRAIVEHAPFGIALYSRDNRFEDSNAAFQRISGYSAEELRGMSWPALTHPDDVTRNSFLLQGVMNGAQPSYDFEQRCVIKNGQTIWVRVVGSRLDENRIISMIEDITERKVSAERLRQSQKLEAVGQLAGGVAHDFNNLLMVISSYGEMLRERIREDAKADRYAEQILGAAQRAASLTQQLLAFSRKQVLAPRILDLNSAVEDISTMVKRLIGEDIELAFRPAEALGLIEADPGQITQVLLNLCVNARDAMPRGGRIGITTRNVEIDESTAARHPSFIPGCYVMLTVCDNGAGMTKTVQERIFEPFFTTKTDGRGTGLGLATVYGIVKQSGGYIWVYSEPGRGTCFKLYFPRTDKQAAEEMRFPVQRSGGGETILVVEDETTLRSVVCEHLQQLGYDILEAANGEKALEIAESYVGPIHLVLSDVIMPKMSGPEVAARIRELPNRKQVKTIFMSGYTDGEIIKHGALDVAVKLLQKPFSLTELASKTREVLDQGSRP